MDYSSSLKYLNSFFNLEKINGDLRNRRWNLDRTRYLLEIFDHPEAPFFPVVIAGTKGKGSTGFFLESILQASGITTGFYCSPHLQTPRERIRIGGKMISRKMWAASLAVIQKTLKKKPLPARLGRLTYFEVMTVLAMLVFRKCRVRAGIFEVGMGGRFDAVNVLNAPLSIITTLGLDHEAFLGKTLPRITMEKAAVIRPGAHVVIAPQEKAALKVLQDTIRRKKAVLHRAAPLRADTALPGDFQRINAGAARKAAEILQKKYGLPVTEQTVRRGLARKDWPGRAEIISKKPLVMIDAAHNPSSIEALAAYLRRKFSGRRLIVVFGTPSDKKSDLMLKALSGTAQEIILTRAAGARSQQLSVLMGQARGLFPFIYPAGTSQEAIDLARHLADAQSVIVVTGSFYLAGEVKDKLCGKVL